MSLDINIFRAEKGGNPDMVRESVKKRFGDVAVVDQVIQLDEEWRKAKFALDNMAKQDNALKKEIGNVKKKDKEADVSDLMAKRDEVTKAMVEQKESVAELAKEIQKTARKVGNMVHESVPVSKDEAESIEVSKWGDIPDLQINSTKGRCHHHEILAMIDGYDPKRGQKIAGHRGFFLKGPGALLNMALQNYGMQFLAGRNYQPMTTPQFMKKEIMAQTCQLGDFDDQLYKVSGNNNEEYYLIATSEQPISSYYMNETLEKKDLPIKFGGVSTCFRKEAGAHGKDTWGVFRVHQFEKIEQFCLTAPEDSWTMLENMRETSEEFYKSLKLPYRVINIVSGELNDAAAKKYDLEAWFPGYNAYRELVSCSNCTDYQSRGLEIRLGSKKKTAEGATKEYVHMLNGTLVACQRTLSCILENYQREDGVEVPEVLQPFMGGLKFIPYTKPIPKKADLE